MAKSTKKISKKSSVSIADPKNVILAILGAIALSLESSKGLFDKLVKRGTSTQKNLEKKTEEIRSKARKRIEEVQENVQKTLNKIGISQEKAGAKEKAA